jgi:hypothetical protein
MIETVKPDQMNILFNNSGRAVTRRAEKIAFLFDGEESVVDTKHLGMSLYFGTTGEILEQFGAQPESYLELIKEWDEVPQSYDLDSLLTDLARLRVNSLVPIQMSPEVQRIYTQAYRLADFFKNRATWRYMKPGERHLLAAYVDPTNFDPHDPLIFMRGNQGDPQLFRNRIFERALGLPYQNRQSHEVYKALWNVPGVPRATRPESVESTHNGGNFQKAG